MKKSLLYKTFGANTAFYLKFTFGIWIAFVVMALVIIVY